MTLAAPDLPGISQFWQAGVLFASPRSISLLDLGVAARGTPRGIRCWPPTPQFSPVLEPPELGRHFLDPKNIPPYPSKSLQ
jgi:hypothetical protein